jgi:tetratricopeptide (TPR) repeat protein
MEPPPSEAPPPEAEPPPVQATPPTTVADVPEDATPAARGAMRSSQAALAAKLNEEGKAAMYAQRYADATAKFREAVARVPEANYFFNLCLALYQEGRFSEALTACDATLTTDPTPTLSAKATKMIDRIRTEARHQGVSLGRP